ncbi:hypothetical protein LguiB_024246 [Lonicera macranthoides]
MDFFVLRPAKKYSTVPPIFENPKLPFVLKPEAEPTRLEPDRVRHFSSARPESLTKSTPRR